MDDIMNFLNNSFNSNQYEKPCVFPLTLYDLSRVNPENLRPDM
jgi:hypothetical protein